MRQYLKRVAETGSEIAFEREATGNSKVDLGG